MVERKWRIESEQVNPIFPDANGISLATNCNWWELVLTARGGMMYHDDPYDFWDLSLKAGINGAAYYVPINVQNFAWGDFSGGSGKVSGRFTGELKLNSGVVNPGGIDNNVVVEDAGSYAYQDTNVYNFNMFNRFSDPYIQINPLLNVWPGFDGLWLYTSLIFRRGYYV